MQKFKDTVCYAANLARVDLEPQELDKLSGQLQNIMDFIDQLKNVDVENINPTSHILPINSVARLDNPVESLAIEKTLANAPAKSAGFFSVPKVI
jgi:aspartyl-tRNA(Asn)/glutamyl-tRNA(Gln) amidotransferase subunit C